MVSILPLFVLGSTAIRRGEIALDREMRLKMAASVSGAAGKLREFLLNLKHGTLALSHDTRIANTLEKSGTSNSPGEPATAAELREILVWYQEILYDAQEVFVLSPAGVVLASSNPSNVGEDWSKEAFFIGGKRGFSPGNLLRKQSEKITWIMAAPIRASGRTNLLGVVGCRVAPETLSELTTGRRSISQGAQRELYRIGETGETYLVNGQRLMITESRDIPNAILNVKVNTLPVRKAIDSGEEFSGRYVDYRGKEVRGNSVIFPDMGWVLITEMDIRQAMAPIRHLRHALLLTLLGLGLVITFWAWRWTRNVVAPIQNAAECESAVVQGNEAAATMPEKDLPDNEIGDFIRTRNRYVKALFEKQRQLATEQRKREEASRELEQISYSIIHDMRAPLRAIINFAQILKEEAERELNDEHRDFLERMIKAATRMDRLITDMLSYSRLAREEIPVHEVNVSRMLRELVETYPDLWKLRSQIHIPEKIPDVKANEAALTQCFSALLNNAVKFVEPGVEPEIHISAKQSGGRVRISVKDNGIGIPRHIQERIFGIFQQGAASQTNTGIGLALVKKATERMGGKVGLISEPGKGSEFWIKLPAA